MSIIVGDIHGNVEKAKAFLTYKQEIEHVALGDYVDSYFEPVERQVECLQLLLDSKAVLLWGNHDLRYLAKPHFICAGPKSLSLQWLSFRGEGQFTLRPFFNIEHGTFKERMDFD